MQQRDLISLRDILQASQNVSVFVDGKAFSEFEADIQCQYAVIRGLEIIGEATARLSDDCRLAYPDIPWREMKGMRNILIHSYDGIDLSDVWGAATRSIPDLIVSLDAILASAPE